MRVAFVAVMVGSLYLLFAGHNQPGGGFVGGIVAGAAIALRYIAGGIDEVRRLSRSRPWTILGAGVLLAVTVAIVPLLLGDAVLDGGIVDGRPAAARQGEAHLGPARSTSASTSSWSASS